jgi:hypothetical protein
MSLEIVGAVERLRALVTFKWPGVARLFRRQQFRRRLLCVCGQIRGRFEGRLSPVVGSAVEILLSWLRGKSLLISHGIGTHPLLLTTG